MINRRFLLLALSRTAAVIPQILAVTFVAFILIRLLPGTPAALILGPQATESSVASLTKSMGLDKPVQVQYWLYLKRLAAGDLGQSWFTSQPVTKDLSTRAPATLELLIAALFVAIVVGLAIGVIGAVRPRGVASRLATWYMRLAGAFPDFWIGLVAIFVFFYLLKIFPAPVGRLDISLTPPPHVTGFYTVDAALAGDGTALRSALAHLALPALVLGLIVAPMIAKITTTTMRSVLASDYIRYAHATGLPRFTIWRYALRNSLPPVVTITGVLVAYLLGGAVLIEKIFAWGGIGQYAVQAVSNSDYAAIQGFLLVAAVFTTLVYLVVDLVNMALDPRTRA